MFVNVILNTSVKQLDKIFTYIVPVDLEQYICIGKRVVVPFSKSNRKEFGIVIDIVNKVDFDANLAKPIVSIVDEIPYIDEFHIKLAKWMSKRYICNLSDSLKVMFPPDVNNKDKTIRSSKKDKYVVINENIQDISKYLELAKRSAKRKEILHFIFDMKIVLLADIYSYFNATSATMKWFIENNIIEIKEEIKDRNIYKKYSSEKNSKLVLTSEQENVYDGLKKLLDSNKKQEALLHGVTGSGKTEIYMQIIEYVLKQNKNCMILVPEISLTPQMANRFLSRFGNIVSILHSKLSNGERIDEFARINNGEIQIVIGARSAIFAPLRNIGIIVIDEEHDNSYKSESNPKYDTIEVARRIIEHNKGLLLLGSATPSIQSYYMAKTNKIALFELKKRINDVHPLSIKLVDLIHSSYVDSSRIITKELANEIQRNIDNKEQSIIFLNKRGYGSGIVCQECGNIEKCPNCDVTLTYHHDKNKLLCHYCGYTKNFDNSCSQCHGKMLKTNVLGTQKIELELNKLFPTASIIRIDHDSVQGKDGHIKILNKFKNENIDILIGTQMIAKGHDFPNVTLVGVLNGDMTLYLQDYRVNELTYSLLTQVAGRAGRDKKPGRVLIQTYQPSNEVFESVINNDYIKMYENEINYRKLLIYPPFCDIIQILITSKDEILAEQFSNKFLNVLTNKLSVFIDKEELIIYQPVKAVISRIEKQYRYKIIIKCKYSPDIAVALKEVLVNNNKNFNISVELNATRNI